MGSKGGSAPNGLTQRELSTVFLRVPFHDWAKVSRGMKTEFRMKPRDGSRVLSVNAPTPVVAYAVSARGVRKNLLMVMLDHWREPLIALSDRAESLANEGFETYDEFRRYWRKRQHGVYNPMTMVEVFLVRPWHSDDREQLGPVLLDRLYGEHAPQV